MTVSPFGEIVYKSERRFMMRDFEETLFVVCDEDFEMLAAFRSDFRAYEWAKEHNGKMVLVTETVMKDDRIK